MRPFRLGVCLWLCLGTSAAWAADPRDPLARARLFYNSGNFEAAVDAADEARRAPGLADAADLVSGRSYLERYRQGEATPDLLERARERFRRINPRGFTTGERLELVVGLGEVLYLDEAWGASADVFESVLLGGHDLTPDAREGVLDWWAMALDRSARPRPDIERQEVYQRIRDRAVAELGARPGNGVASYWASAAARGQGDLQAAWDAAQAGWARASMTTDQGQRLRQDLSELVERAIVPERARILALPPSTLTAEWERFKEKWAR